MTYRTSQGLYPELPPPVVPSAPPSDDGFQGSSEMSSDSGGSRGILRPHSESPFLRNVRARIGNEEEEVDMEAISCLLDFARREPRTPPSAITTVGSFAASGAASGSLRYW